MDYKDYLKSIYCTFCLKRIEIVEWAEPSNILEQMYPRIKFNYTGKYWHEPCIQKYLDILNGEV